MSEEDMSPENNPSVDPTGHGDSLHPVGQSPEGGIPLPDKISPPVNQNSEGEIPPPEDIRPPVDQNPEGEIPLPKDIRPPVPENNKEDTKTGTWADWLLPADDTVEGIVSEDLKRMIKAYSLRPDVMATLDSLQQIYERIEGLWVDGKIEEPEAQIFLGRVRDKMESVAQVKEGVPNVQTTNAKNIEEGVYKAERRRLGDQLGDFLNLERWCDEPYQFNLDNPPLFFVEANKEQKELYKTRAELVRAVNYKKEKGANLEGLGNNTELMGLSARNMEILCREPGVNRALVIYIEMMIKDVKIDVNGVPKSIRESDTQNIEIFRAWVENRLLSEGVVSNQQQAKAAEQIAFNIHYVAQTFESLDSQWVEHPDGTKTRTRPSICKNGEICKIPIRFSMKPLETLASNTVKSEKEFIPFGAFGEWSWVQTQSSMAQTGIKKFDKIVVLPADEGNIDKFWTLKQSGAESVLYAPECYPVYTFRSVWEDTTLSDGRTLLEALQTDGRIDWTDSSVQNIWVDYMLKIQKVNTLMEYYKGKKGVGLKNFGSVSDWGLELLDALANVKKRTREDVIRWALYASIGVESESRAPRVKLNSYARLNFEGDFDERGIGLFKRRETYFPWDRPTLFQRLT